MDELCRELERYRRDDGRRRRQWWFLFDPTLKGVFYRGIANASDWLENKPCSDDASEITCWLVGGRFVGDISYDRPVTRRKASYDLKIDRNYLCGVPSSSYRRYTGMVVGEDEVLSESDDKRFDLEDLNCIYENVHKSVELFGVVTVMADDPDNFIDYIEGNGGTLKRSVYRPIKVGEV
jgi:hypothetical protein